MREQKPITASRGASPTTRSSNVTTAIFRIMIYKVLRAWRIPAGQRPAALRAGRPRSIGPRSRGMQR
jgi:hypothetical protein